jgi:hypothetical protein
VIEALQEVVNKGGGGGQGILYGQLDGTGTVVESSYALEAFVIEKMRQAVAKAHRPVVGFYRIRDGNSRELTPEETSLAMELFAKPGSVILTVERRAEGPRANAFLFDHGAFVSLPRGRQFPVDVGTLIEREAQRARLYDDEALVPAAPVLVPLRSRSSSPALAVKPNPAARRRWWSAAHISAFSIAISAAVAYFSVAQYINRLHDRTGNPVVAGVAATGAKTSLRAERQGEDLKILWDLNSPAVASATSGILDIEDGGKTRQIPMTADQVRFGSLVYSPGSEQVSVRLTTFKDGQRTTRESVLVLLKSPQPQSGSGRQNQNIPLVVRSLPTSSEEPDLAESDSPAHLQAPTRAFVAPAVNHKVTGPAVEFGDAPAARAIPARADLPATPLGFVPPPPPPVAAPRAVEPVTPQQTEYVAPVLVSQQGARSPPELMLRHSVTVSVRVDINEAGKVIHAEPIPEKGTHRLLLDAARDAAFHCRFQPARQGKSPVPSTITLVFHIGPKE